jgi:hypothetical protein
MAGIKNDIRKVDSIIHNRLLAEAICRSIESGVINSHVHGMGRTVWEVFKYSLDAAIREIETHPRGNLFQRFLDYGPLSPDEPEKLTSDGKTFLSDPECGACIHFIFSHMVNRFKGELAELLAIAPCLELIEQLQGDGMWTKKVDLYLGDAIQERRSIKVNKGRQWGEFTKGADGLIVNITNPKSQDRKVSICGIIEVKSMPRSETKLLSQIKHHLNRIDGGLKLEGKIWGKQEITHESPMFIMVVPSNWKLSRECYYRDGKLIYPKIDKPPYSTQIEKLTYNQWKITLDWSKEALEQAAYEMTYWYMSQVGTVIYKKKSLPKGWENMSAEEAGYNAIKMMLYYAMLRYITPRQGQRATKLYNAYSFGYPLAMDAKEMLWPEDIRNQNMK